MWAEEWGNWMFKYSVIFCENIIIGADSDSHRELTPEAGEKQETCNGSVDGVSSFHFAEVAGFHCLHRVLERVS